MADSAWRGEQYAKKNRFQRRWYKLMMALASIVVFCTTYALILPAITLEQQCRIPEHQHTDDCYTQITTVSHQEFACHWDGQSVIIHHHDSYCYDENGTLRCDLPEVEEHIHGDGCYQRPLLKEGHTHSELCDSRVRGELTCQEHVHTESCYSSETNLICTESEGGGHSHGEGCFDEEGNLICELEETPGHSHGGDCYATNTWLSCGVESDHVHTDDCYTWETVRTCNQEESEPVYGDPVLTCTEPEIIYHAHDDSCYNEEGVLVCEESEVLSHQHSASCWQTVEEPADTEALTCGQEEGENHTHTARCYGTWVQTCGMEEHSHTEECTPEPVYYCGMESHTHLPECYDDAGNLTCQLEEHVHTEECLVEIGFATFEMNETTEPVTTGEPLKINPTKATLSYRTKDAEGNWSEWIVVKDDTKDIPGNASFKLEVNFAADVKGLKAAGYQMVYSPLPDWFRNVTSTDYIKSGDENVGTMKVTDGAVILTFYETWQGLSQEDMTGSFYVEAEADLKSITGDNTTDIVVGDTTIKVNFDGDLIAKYGEVTIDKAMGELEENVPGEDGKYYDYITYTLTVKAGADGCPEVKVVDRFTSGSKYVDFYTIVECPEGTTYSIENNALTWNIGDMEAGATQTLTYKVKLDPNYLGATPKREALTNLATVYSKEYSRTNDSQTFTPQGKATMSKIASEFTPNDSGDGTIRYTVWVHADKDNNYTLENVTIRDALDGSIDGNYKTEEKFLKYVSYNENSFTYYIGGSKEQNGPGDLQPTETTQKPVFAENKKSFHYNVGNLAPGDDRLLVYEVTVDAGVFTQSNVDFQINNRVQIITDPNRTGDGGQRLESYWQSKTITTKKWARKLLGEKVTEETTVDMGNGTFTVPAGSQEYKVVVNETGDWDVSSTVMRDNLNTDHMEYVGYVRVEAYKAAQSTNYGSDAAAAGALEKLEPVQTVWVDINGKTSFEFTPKDLGLTEKNCAYLLTYYAQPKNMEGYSTVIVANEFELTGDVGNGKIYYLGGIHVSASVQLEGSNHFGAQKRFWYYDANTDEQDYGTMYWVLKLSGNTIPKGTMLLDAISEGPHTVDKVERAFIGGYDLEFSEDQTVTDPEGTAFTAYESDITDKGLEVTLTEDVKLEGKCLYFTVSTNPTRVPQTNGQSQVYKNALSIKDPGEGKEWVRQSEDQTHVVAGNNLYKSMQEVFKVEAGDTADNTKITYVDGTENTVLQKDYLMNSGSGVYVAWYVSVNHTATLNGRYRVHETIPAGMELVYVQRYSTAGWRNVTFQEITDLGDNWTRVEQEFTYQDANRTPAIYYVNGQNVIWEFEERDPNPSDPGSRYVDYLVVCKVTDPDLLLGGVEKTYVNQVTLTDTSGKELGQGSADVTLQIPTLGKTGTFENIKDGRYPFEIQLNELGTNLVPEADTIELIDEMCDYLILDLSSIKVFNTKTEEPVKFTSALNDHILTLTLPDNQPLTIKYETTINAVPGSEINITNNAYWKGYTSTPGSSVSKSDFTYSVGAQVTTSTNPDLTISKVDQYDTGIKLEGAEFTLTEVKLVDGKFEVNEGGLTLTGTTDKNGEVVFGKGEEKLSCNVPYQLVETKAPDGYVQDETPRYFVFANETNDTDTTEKLKSYQNAGANILSGATATYTVTNHKGEILVEKKFANADGSTLGKVDGTYTFGLFEEGSETCLQKATIKWGNGVVSPTDGKAHFTNVELGKEYVVYELDDNGDPIPAGESGTVSGIPFVVSYAGNGVTVRAEEPTGSVTVTNRINYPELPHTGGAGSEVYTAAGATLTAAALWLMYNQRKRRREGSTPS